MLELPKNGGKQVLVALISGAAYSVDVFLLLFSDIIKPVHYFHLKDYNFECILLRSNSTV